MSEMDAAVQLVKIEMDAMTMVCKVAGRTGAKILQAFLQIVESLGKKAITSHKMKKIEDIKGICTMDEFKKKYAGDNINLITIKDDNLADFADLCKKEGVAVVKLPKLNRDEGETQFMVAGSTIDMIRFNFEKLNQWEMSQMDEQGNPKLAEGDTVGRELDIQEYIEKAPGKSIDEKLQNVKKTFEEDEVFKQSSSEEMKSLDFTNPEEVKKFLTNASNDEKTFVLTNSEFEKIPINVDKIVGEDDKSITLMTDEGESIDVDKSIHLQIDGKHYIFASDDKDNQLGSISIKGESITAETLKNKLEPERQERLNAYAEMSKGYKAPAVAAMETKEEVDKKEISADDVPQMENTAPKKDAPTTEMEMPTEDTPQIENAALKKDAPTTEMEMSTGETHKAENAAHKENISKDGATTNRAGTGNNLDEFYTKKALKQKNKLLKQKEKDTIRKNKVSRFKRSK